MATSAAYIELDEGVAPSTPAAGKVRVYAKADGSTYQKDDIGTETGLAAAGGAGLGAWTSYVPVWTTTATAPTLGNATLTGRYKALDANTYLVYITFIYGSTSAPGTGSFQFSLPATAVTGFGVQLLTGHILDSGTDSKLATGRINAGDNKVFQIVPEGGNATSGTSPMTWATGDTVELGGMFEV